ncbi:TRAP transporter substrate-binding protein DctP [Chelativorans sp. Marseille-P2723]|uniref:TRAP transporter substrate-binding protein DctP n=1 Tax=Chelativorans sp. Marseille-P2723 TaxID=2709133 RepID=UPI00156ED359|nr:TRAP transporter substrate-binding protein DctP [Chelativorans sp. Marseille-P2723]
MRLGTKLKAVAAASSIAAAAAFGSALPALAQQSIIYSTYAHQGAISTRGNLWFIEEVAKRSDGKFAIKDTFFSGALLKGADQIEGLGDGIADAGYVCTGYDITRFPLASMAEMPYLTEKGDALAAAVNELYETYPPLKEEFHRNNLELLGTESPSPMIIGVGKDVRIEKAADLAGLKIRAFGPHAELLRDGGGIVPVFVEVSEIGTGLQTGLIDGYSTLPLWYPAAANFIDMTTNIVSPGVGTYYSCNISMNLDTYNSLDEDVKQIIAEVRKEFPKKTIELTIEGDQETLSQGKEAGINFYKFTPEEVEEWKSRLDIDSLRAAWIEERQKYTNADVSEFTDKLMELVAKYEAQSTYTQDFTP